MIINICVSVVSIAFVVLVIFLVFTLRKVTDTLKRTKHTLIGLDHLSEEGQKLIKTTNDLALDVKEKSEALNIFFRPLVKWNKKKADHGDDKYEKIAEIINFATDSIVLFNRLKKNKKTH